MESDGGGGTPSSSEPRGGTIRVGAPARLDAASGALTWSGRVSWVNGELVGLRGTTAIDGRLSPRDVVTLHLGTGESLVSNQARVLSATGAVVRLLVRESRQPSERRRATRVPIRGVVPVLVELDSDRIESELVDLSMSGCALRSDTALTAGSNVVLVLRLGGVQTRLPGQVVRTWSSGVRAPEHAGVQFAALPPPVVRHLKRLLVDQLHEGVRPALAGVARPVAP